MNLRFFGLSLTDTSLVAISDITKHLFDVSLDFHGCADKDGSARSIEL
jgi:hypothetical protein